MGHDNEVQQQRREKKSLIRAGLKREGVGLVGIIVKLHTRAFHRLERIRQTELVGRFPRWRVVGSIFSVDTYCALMQMSLGALCCVSRTYLEVLLWAGNELYKFCILENRLHRPKMYCVQYEIYRLLH